MIYKCLVKRFINYLIIQPEINILREFNKFSFMFLWREKMRDTGRGPRRGGPRRGGPRGPRRSFGPREMHKAICSECGSECEVPFKPAEGKPVYCRECYRKKKRF